VGLAGKEPWPGYDRASTPVTDPAPSMECKLEVPGLDSAVTRGVESRSVAYGARVACKD
jgi:hypothetical protein